MLIDANVPCGPIRDIAQVFDDPQVQARGMVADVSHPQLGDVRTVASPLRFSKTPVAYRQAPPLLGEHTADVLRNVLEMDEAAIESLFSRGIV